MFLRKRPNFTTAFISVTLGPGRPAAKISGRGEDDGLRERDDANYRDSCCDGSCRRCGGGTRRVEALEGAMDYGPWSRGTRFRCGAFPEDDCTRGKTSEVPGGCECGQSIHFVCERKGGRPRAEPRGSSALEI